MSSATFPPTLLILIPVKENLPTDEPVLESNRGRYMLRDERLEMLAWISE
jgi:hypothetical protein